MQVQLTAPEPRLLGLVEAGHFLGVTRRSLEHLIARGVLRPVRLAGLRRTLLDRQDLERLVKASKTEPTQG